MHSLVRWITTKRLYMYSNWSTHVGHAPDLLLNLDVTSNVLHKFLCVFFCYLL